jgi:hypothetical protein
MNILSIESIYQEGEVVYVSAVVDEMVEVYSQTLYDPAEYGPALCETSFSIDDSTIVPDNDLELIDFIENLDLEWEIVDTSDYLD